MNEEGGILMSPEASAAFRKWLDDGAPPIQWTVEIRWPKQIDADTPIEVEAGT